MLDELKITKIQANRILKFDGFEMNFQLLWAHRTNPYNWPIHSLSLLVVDPDQFFNQPIKSFGRPNLFSSRFISWLDLFSHPIDFRSPDSLPHQHLKSYLVPCQLPMLILVHVSLHVNKLGFIFAMSTSRNWFITRHMPTQHPVNWTHFFNRPNRPIDQTYLPID